MHAPLAVKKMSRDKLAAVLVEVYYNVIFTRMSRFVRGTKLEYSALTEGDREKFRKAADSCLLADAKPTEYIVAQFEEFDFYSQRYHKHILPQPHQLYGLAAQARYFTWKNRQEERKSEQEPEKKDFKREERKLAGMSRMFRREPHEILVEKPSEFTQEFLEYRGVWELVRSTYQKQIDE